MSRCFSFPPPGYLRNTNTLIEESIKIRLDTEKPNKDRKEKKDKKDRNETKEERKLRKEKKRERKEKRKREKEETTKDSTSHSSAGSLKFKVVDERKDSREIGKLQKREYCENEHIEKSDITEELDKPVFSPQEPYSSDSSQSSKRKRDTLLSSKDHGTGIRIRLPLRKHEEVKEEGYQLGSSSRSVRISDSISQETSRVQRPLHGITKVEKPNQLPVNSASNSKVCRPPLVKVETPNQRAGFSASQVCRPSLKKVETHSASQVCRPQVKKAETHSASQVCRPQVKKAETLLPATLVCRPPVKKVETLLPRSSASQVCRPPLKKVETRLPGNSASQVCRPPLKNRESRLLGNSTSNVCRPLLKEVETPNQLPGTSASKVCRPPLKKEEAPSQLSENSASTICRPLKNLVVPQDAPSKVCRPLKNLVPVDAPIANETVDEESRRIESLYNSLLHIPPIKYDCFDSLDQDWLFSSAPTESKPVSKKQKIDDAFQCSKSLCAPRAQYMPEVEMYALPYTVPF